MINVEACWPAPPKIFESTGNCLFSSNSYDIRRTMRWGMKFRGTCDRPNFLPTSVLPQFHNLFPSSGFCNTRRICWEKFYVCTYRWNVRYLVFLVIFSELTWSAFAVSVCQARPGQAKATGRTWFKRGWSKNKNNENEAGHPPRVTADWLASGLQNVHCPCKFTCGANGEGAHSRKNHH